MRQSSMRPASAGSSARHRLRCAAANCCDALRAPLRRRQTRSRLRSAGAGTRRVLQRRCGAVRRDRRRRRRARVVRRFRCRRDRHHYDLAIGAGPAPVTAATIVRTDAAQGVRREISVAAPLPADVMISFDPADGPPSATFSVETTREPFGAGSPTLTWPLPADRAAGSESSSARTPPPRRMRTPMKQPRSLWPWPRGVHAEVFNSLDALVAFGPDLVHLSRASGRLCALDCRVGERSTQAAGRARTL